MSGAQGRPPGLAARGVTKLFGRRTVLDAVDLDLDGGVVALTGSNGAGKTTLLHILAGAVEADAGNVSVCGFDLGRRPREARALLSFVPAEPTVYPFLTGDELLRFVGCTKGHGLDGAVAELLEAFGLAGHRGKRFDEMSLGTQRKFYLVAALRADPRVLIMDEPTNALDAGSLAFLRQYFNECPESRTVIFASHDSAFVAATAARVLHLKDGRAGFVDPP